MLGLLREDILVLLDVGLIISDIGFNTYISIILYQYFGGPYILFNI
jgi:hypothetical protein